MTTRKTATILPAGTSPAEAPPVEEAELPPYREEFAVPDVHVTLPQRAPGPGARVTRTAGQAGGALVLIELWQSFGWFGAAGWSADEAAQRWPALSAALLFAISVGHNLAGFWRRDERR